MEKTVLETINRFNLLAPGDIVLVAVSGGADSLCLLHLLCRLKHRLGITLHVAHVNHGLRPEAAAEARYVKKWALRLGLPVTVCRVDVGACGRAGGYSKQDAARRVRYASLYKVARRTGANRLAVAHHLDDRAETILLRLINGSGLDGLAGIPVRREMAGKLTLIRPLFNVWRNQIDHYCSSHNLKPVLDRSNLSTHYIRNRIRLRLLPFMEAEFGRHVRASLAKASDLLARDSGLLAELTERAFRKNVTYNGKDYVLSLSHLHRLPAALQARLLRRMMWAAGVERPSATHVRAVQALARACSPSGQISLPGGITASRVYTDIRIGKQTVSKPVPDGISRLLIPGHTILPWSGQIIEASIVDAAGLRFPLKNRMEACLDLDRLDLPLIVRTRRPGDRVQLLGAAGGRKIKNILIDKKIPAKERDFIPLVESGGRIAWIGGVEIAHSFRVTPDTKRVLYLKLCQTKG